MAGNEQKIEKIVAGGGMGAGIVGVGKMLGVDGGGIDATMGGQGVKIGVRSDTSLPSLKPSTAGEEINGFGKVLEHVVQGKVLPKGLSSNLLEEADLLRHSQGLEQQARAAGEVNRRAAQQLPSILGQLRNMASGAVLAAQQRWSMDKGLSLIKMAGSDGLLDSNQATLMAETYQNGMRQDRLNQLLEENPADAERQMQEDPLLQEMKQEERELFLKRLARRRETQPLDQAWRQVRMPQAHNRLEQTMQQSDYYIKQAQEGLLPPSLLGDLEVRRALPAFTMNLVGQFSSTAMKQSARHQAYITRMQQGVETTPLDPSNQDDVNAADYYYQLSYGNTPPQQLAERLPDLIALTKIVPPSAKASISRLLHGRDGVKFGQRLADVWINNPNVAHQLPDEVLLHSFAANTLLPNWRLGGNMGQGDDQDHRLYYLLNPLAAIHTTAQDNSLEASVIKASDTAIILTQRNQDLQFLEYQAASIDDPVIRNRLLDHLLQRRLELAYESVQKNLPASLMISAVSPHITKYNFLDRTLSATADGISNFLGLSGDLVEFFERDQREAEARLGYKMGPNFNLAPHLYKSHEIREQLAKLIPKADAETVFGRLWQTFVSGITGGGAISKIGMITNATSSLSAQISAELGAPEFVQFLFGLAGDRVSAYAGRAISKTLRSNPNMMQMGQSGGNGNTPTNVPSSTQNTPLTPNTPGQLGTAQPGTTLTQPVTNPTQPPHNPLNQANPNSPSNAPGSPQHTPLQNIKGTIYSTQDIPSIHDATSIPRRPLPDYTPQQLEVFRNNTSDWHRRNDWSIEVMDLVGGHGTKHIYDGPKATADRILNPRPGERIPTASTHAFTPAHMDSLVKETLRHNAKLIDEWFPNVGPNKAIKLEYEPLSGELTGYGIKRGENNFSSTQRITVILIRTQNGYIIDNYYPSFE